MRAAAIVITVATLAGCASSLSGLGGSERLSCKAPEGVVCTSVSGVYANTTALVTQALPAAAVLTTVHPTLTTLVTPVKPASTFTALDQDSTGSLPNAVLRSAPRVLRLWIAPWEDSDGDLHQASTIHVLVDNGRWLLNPVRAIGRNRIDAVAPPLSGAGGNTAPNVASELPVRGETLSLPGGAAPASTTLPR